MSRRRVNLTGGLKAAKHLRLASGPEGQQKLSGQQPGVVIVCHFEFDGAGYCPLSFSCHRGVRTYPIYAQMPLYAASRLNCHPPAYPPALAFAGRLFSDHISLLHQHDDQLTDLLNNSPTLSQRPGSHTGWRRPHISLLLSFPAHF